MHMLLVILGDFASRLLGLVSFEKRQPFLRVFPVYTLDVYLWGDIYCSAFIKGEKVKKNNTVIF